MMKEHYVTVQCLDDTIPVVEKLLSFLLLLNIKPSNSPPPSDFTTITLFLLDGSSVLCVGWIKRWTKTKSCSFLACILESSDKICFLSVVLQLMVDY